MMDVRTKLCPQEEVDETSDVVVVPSRVPNAAGAPVVLLVRIAPHRQNLRIIITMEIITTTTEINAIDEKAEGMDKAAVDIREIDAGTITVRLM